MRHLRQAFKCGVRIHVQHQLYQADLVQLAGASAFLIAGPTIPVLAEASKIKLEGASLQLKRGTDGKIIRPSERVLVGTGGAVS